LQKSATRQGASFSQLQDICDKAWQQGSRRIELIFFTLMPKYPPIALNKFNEEEFQISD
jgi:hypothetical protein